MKTCQSNVSYLSHTWPGPCEPDTDEAISKCQVRKIGVTATTLPCASSESDENPIPAQRVTKSNSVVGAFRTGTDVGRYEEVFEFE